MLSHGVCEAGQTEWTCQFSIILSANVHVPVKDTQTTAAAGRRRTGTCNSAIDKPIALQYLIKYSCGLTSRWGTRTIAEGDAGKGRVDAAEAAVEEARRRFLPPIRAEASTPEEVYAASDIAGEQELAAMGRHMDKAAAELEVSRRQGCSSNALNSVEAWCTNGPVHLPHGNDPLSAISVHLGRPRDLFAASTLCEA